MFTPELKDWPAPHRKLLLVLLVALGAILLLAWLFVTPRLHQYRRTRQLCLDCEAEIAKWTWPANARLLQAQRNICREKLDGDPENNIPGLRQISLSALNAATSTFQKQISAAYPAPTPEESVDAFVNNASRIDYRLFANQLEQELQKHNCHLPSALLTIEESSKIPIYQKIIHIWTLQFILHTALENHLSIAPSPSEEGECGVSLLPILSYRISANDTEPYLQEFPVQFTVVGTMETFLAFLKALHANGAFIPVKQLSIESRPPQSVKEGQDLRIEQHFFSAVGTSFFLPQTPESPADSGAAPSTPAPPAP
jgi:hypothetical protein